MDEPELYQALSANLRELTKLEADITTLQVAEFQKKAEKIRDEKLYNLREYLEQKAAFYGRDIEEHQSEVDELSGDYKNQMVRLTNGYEKILAYIFEVLQNALNNQKIAVSNIMTLDAQLVATDDLDEEEKERLTRLKIACAGKKINYEVIVRECRARVEWCLKNMQRDMYEIFEARDTEIIEYDEGFFTKIERWFTNVFLGKRNFLRTLDDFENRKIKKATASVETKILDLAYELTGIEKQMIDAKNQIAILYKDETKEKVKGEENNG